MFVNSMSESHRMKIAVKKYVNKPSRKKEKIFLVKISMLNNIAKRVVEQVYC